MPELPEVEVVRAGLERLIGGRTISAVDVVHPRAIRRQPGGEPEFRARLIGCQVEAVRRRGKYLWMPLEQDAVLLAHLGMSGQLLVAAPGAQAGPHLRVGLTFADGGSQLRFIDQRTFGGLWVADKPADGVVPEPIVHIAPDPMDPAFDSAAFYRRTRRRRTGIKRALLDQTFVSGVGNIYADEALWRAGLHWARPTETLTRREVDGVIAALRSVLAAATTAGGTSFDALYVNVNGDSGYFDRSLDVYGREGEPCRRCEARVLREPFMNRSAYTCPGCQPRPRRARW